MGFRVAGTGGAQPSVTDKVVVSPDAINGGIHTMRFTSDPLHFHYLPVLTAVMGGFSGVIIAALLRFAGAYDLFLFPFHALCGFEVGWLLGQSGIRFLYGDADPYTIPIPYLRGLYAPFAAWRAGIAKELAKKGFQFHKSVSCGAPLAFATIITFFSIIGFSKTMGEPGIAAWYGCLYLPGGAVEFGLIWFVTARVGVMRMFVYSIGWMFVMLSAIFLSQGPYASPYLVGLGILIVLPLTLGVGWLMGGSEV
jgi:hypothetical protein